MIVTPRFALAATALGLVLAVAVAYHNSLGGPFVFDDRAAILDNSTIRQLWPITEPLSPPAGGQSVSGRPLVNLSLAINNHFGGTNPTGYHVFNVLVHTLAALTLFGIVRRTWRSPRDQSGEAGLFIAAGIALLWALHPLQTAAVSYVVQRAESMMGLFYLLTLYCFVRAVGVNPSPAGAGKEGAGGRDAEDRGNMRPRLPKNGEPNSAGTEARRYTGLWFAASIISCLCGMATKEVMVTAPVMVLLYDRTFLAGSFHGAWRQRRGYYVALAGTWILLGWLLLGSHGRGGTVGFSAEASAWSYLLTQCEALVKYVRLSVWPHPLVFDYGEQLVTRFAAVWPQALLLIALLGGTVVALRSRPRLGFLGAWFFLILAPTSSVVPITSQTIAEHRMYLPLAAVIIALAAGAQVLLGRRVRIVLLVLACVAGGLTIARNRTYATEVSLWADTAARVPDNARAHANLGSALLDAGRLEEAAAACTEAARLQPDAAELHANLCQVYTRLNRPALAQKHGERAVELAPEDPDARINLASVFVSLGRFEDAIAHFAVAHRIQPDAIDLANAFADTLLKQAHVFARQGRLAEAQQRAAEATQVAPSHAEAHFARGNFAAAAQDFGSALSAFQRAVELAPTEVAAWTNLGNCQLVTGRLPDAIATYEQVLRMKPDAEAVRQNLALAREELRKKQR